MTRIFQAFLTLVIFTPVLAMGENQTSFSKEELSNLSPFDPIVQEKVLKDVIRLMNDELNPENQIPPVRVSESVSLEETAIIDASESQGMPGWAVKKGINIYLFELNMILLGSDMKIHNLAHEYAHYVQMVYKGMVKQEFSMDYPEQEAVHVQNYFREPFN